MRGALAAAARIRWESDKAAGVMELYDRPLSRMDDIRSGPRLGGDVSGRSGRDCVVDGVRASLAAVSP